MAMIWRHCDRCGATIDDSGNRLMRGRPRGCPDCAPDRIPCTCTVERPENCRRHGIAASNDRQNNYWVRVGGHD